MTGYVLMYGQCFGCHRVFGFNPHRVPSIPIEGDRKPICAACIAIVNPKRKELGLDPIVPKPDAYEPIEEHEL